ncbi:MAG: type III PLP-dependent enzyme [Pseudomonadota bacterium]|nr:type III PLP-dependent enzyme [Pseudomonadota bacterium]
METFESAADLIRVRRPERPVLCMRPHAARRAARWFLDRFPGIVAYAVKANDSAVLTGALVEEGIRHFDVASLAEAERMAAVPGATLYFMNPIKSRETIRRAYFNLGIRHFSLDSQDELDKILQVTGNAPDLALYVRLACSNKHSLIPLEGKFGVAEADAPALLVRARRAAQTLGITFHVGSQSVKPESYATALMQTDELIRKAGVIVDVIDVGGGFPSRYVSSEPPQLSAFMSEIAAQRDKLTVGDRCQLMCEPGRALVAEAESVLVRVDSRRGNYLYINDGAFGTLFDAAVSGFTFPARLVRAEPGGVGPLAPFGLYGPTCDAMDTMPGPFMLPDCVREGDYIEIHQIGAYGRVFANRFNGFGEHIEAILTDEPMVTMYPDASRVAARTRASRAGSMRRARR